MDIRIVTENTAQLPKQDNARVEQLMRTVFTPHLQEALKQGREAEAPLNELVSASAMAYGNMLEMILGKKPAVDMLRHLANHLEMTDPVRKTQN